MQIAGTAELFARRTAPPGSKPGTWVLPPDTHPTSIRALIYHEARSEERIITSSAELEAAANAPGVTWIEIQGLGDGAMLYWLRDALGVHPLAVSDLANTGQRPKFEDYGERDLIITQLVLANDDEDVSIEQASIVVGPGWVVSVLERPLDVFEPIRERIQSGSAMICRMGHDFLAYTLLDAVIDSYFPFVEQVGEVLNDIEEGVTGRPNQHALNQLHAVRRTLLTVHRVMWRQRDALTQIMRDERSPFGEAVRVYLRDLLDHAMQVLDAIETYREIGVGLSDLYYSSVSNRLNEVMRTLTVISTIFIPLTFLVGVYGMNFDNMPELRTRWGYYVLWVVMVAIAAGLLYGFHRRGWLARTGRPARDDDDNDDDNDA
jgi:magnesium transporter